jgi:hypothetical protein
LGIQANLGNFDILAGKMVKSIPVISFIITMPQEKPLHEERESIQ